MRSFLPGQTVLDCCTRNTSDGVVMRRKLMAQGAVFSSISSAVAANEAAVAEKMLQVTLWTAPRGRRCR
jgi:hypothetical protein